MRQGVLILLVSLASIPVVCVAMGMVLSFAPRAMILCGVILIAWTGIALIVALAAFLGLLICASRPGEALPQASNPESTRQV